MNEPTNFEMSFGHSMEKMAEYYYDLFFGNLLHDEKQEYGNKKLLYGFNVGKFQAYGEILGLSYIELDDIKVQQRDLVRLGQ